MKETPFHFPGLLSDALYFREFANNNPPELVERVIVEQQSLKLNERASGKYGPILFTVNALSNFNPLTKERGKGFIPAMEVCYHFGRAMDDIADGDAQLPNGFENFSEFVDYLKQRVKTGDLVVGNGGYAEFLLMRATQRLAPLIGPNDLKNGVNGFLDSAVAENERRNKGLVLTRQELDDLFMLSFGSSYDIALIATRSINRAKDVRPLIIAQGRSYSLAGLHEDLGNGICNIPRDVLTGSGYRLQQLQENPHITDDVDIINKWKKDDLIECRRFVNSVDYGKLDLKAKLIAFYFNIAVRRAIKEVGENIIDSK